MSDEYNSIAQLHAPAAAALAMADIKDAEIDKLKDLLGRAHYWVIDAAIEGKFLNAAALASEIEQALGMPDRQI